MHKLKKFFLSLLPVFIFLIHLPFVFAKTRPGTQSFPVVSPGSNNSSKVYGINGEELPQSNRPGG
jgi:hypothetical protein